MKPTKFQIKHDHAGIALTVSGERDQDDTTITRVTAADSQIDISELFDSRALELMAETIDAQLDREAREEADEARIDMHIWDREFRVAA